MTGEPRPGVPERGVWIPDAAQRSDLAVFAGCADRLDETAVIRLRTPTEGVVQAWVVTGFDVLAGRAVGGRLRPTELCCAAGPLARGLRGADDSGFYDYGYSMDSAWRGGLPPETGFAHVDDVPAAVFTELARQGAELAREYGPQRPPVSLLDQEVLTVSNGPDTVGVPMRCVLALAAMRFVPDPAPDDEIVRVRATGSWLRIDARFGSVFRRRGDPVLLIR